jgi:hypothetical protein
MATESGRKRVAFVKSKEFIYGAYKPQFWYWEVRKVIQCYSYILYLIS